MTDENQPDTQTGYRHARWTEHFAEIDREIANPPACARSGCSTPA